MRLLWLSTDADKVRLRSEQVLATARAGLAAGGLAAIYLDPTEPARHADFVYSVLGLYVVLSAGTFGLLRLTTVMKPWVPHLLFAIDLIFAGVLTLYTSGTNSPLFVFFWFVLLTAAFRYGFKGALRAGGLLIVVVCLQLLLLPVIDTSATVQVNFVVVRATYLLVMAFLLGYFAQKEQDLRTEAVVVARALARARGESTFARALQGAFDELGGVFHVRRAVLAMRTADGAGRGWRWEQASTGAAGSRLVPLGDAHQPAYFFTMPRDIHVWHATRRGTRPIAALDLAGDRTRLAPQPPVDLWLALGASSAIGVTIRLSDGSEARLFLPDPPAATSSSFMLHLLHVVALQLGPALHNLSLVEKEAASVERTLLARELHDRVVQSLIGLEMQLAVLQRGDSQAGLLQERIRDVHTTLHQEISNVRDLMEELRPLRLRGEDVPTYLAEMVERFQRETTICAVLQCEVERVVLSASQCGDLVRVVQEALVNVRKHSGARDVIVRLAPGAGGVTLTIQDNGCGFPFDGLLGEEQLWSEHRGPRVIKERARAIGAALSIDSRPGHGARLDLIIPYAA